MKHHAIANTESISHSKTAQLNIESKTTATTFGSQHPEAMLQRQRQNLINHSPQVKQHGARSVLMLNSAVQKQSRAEHHHLNYMVQRAEEDEVIQNQSPSGDSAHLRSGDIDQIGHTGLPNRLKAGIESLSGVNLDQVKVHYNSSQPAQLNALAYARGSEIHIGPGQEQHLPHEAWHVVQQTQGRVKPTLQLQEGVPVNDDAGLEQEADVMGAKAMQMTAPFHLKDPNKQTATAISMPIQRVLASLEPALGYSEGGIKIKNLREAIEQYNLAQTARPANLQVLIGCLDDLENRIRRYIKEMTTKELALNFHILDSALKDVYRERSGFNTLLNQGPAVTNINNVATLEASECPAIRRRKFDFSLARHWFPCLSSEAKDLNSIYFHNVSWGEIAADCIEIGNELKTSWDNAVPEPAAKSFTVASGRRYDMDVVGTAGLMNHFYVVNGPQVANVNQNEFIFFRTLSQYKSGQQPVTAVKGAFNVIENAWDDSFVLIHQISGVDMVAAGFKSRSEKARLVHITNTFKQDILAYMNTNALGALPTTMLQAENWGGLGSSLSYIDACEAYKILRSKHQLSFGEKGMTFK